MPLILPLGLLLWVALPVLRSRSTGKSSNDALQLLPRPKPLPVAEP
jgi:hypothetical protein